MAARLAAVAALLLVAVSLGDTVAGTCEFVNEPVYPSYFWDPSCKPGGLGCLADGKNVQCRFCGGTGSYANIPCRSDSCTFVNEPFVPYYWDPNCTLGQLGCWADGVHKECRFCGKFPYTSIPCPADVGGQVVAACTFKNEPTAKYGWDPSCRRGMLGCLADGVHEGCRYCEEGPYAHISCAQNPAEKKCTFVNEPTVPYFWDPKCTVGQLGCLADGIHAECRFCAHRPFESIPCPNALPAGKCTFPPLRSEPTVPYYWEPACVMGVLGCWADGLHGQCRFCGTGVYSGIPCPANATFPPGSAGALAAAVHMAAAAEVGEATQTSGLGAAATQGEALEATAAAAAVPHAAAPVARDVKPVAMDAKPAGEVQVNGALGQGRAALPLALGAVAAAAAAVGRGGL